MPKKAGRKRKRVTPEMVEEMRRLREEGLAHQEIAKRLGVAPMTARKYLKQEAPVGFVKGQERKTTPIVIIVAVVLIIAAVVVASAGYYLMTRRGGPVVTYKTYTNENYSIRFDYPENWDFSSQDFGLPPPFVAYFDAGSSTGLTGEILLYVFDKAGYENRYAVSLDNLTSYVASLENQFENNENFVVRSPPTVVAIDNHNGVRLSATAVQSTSFDVRFQLETVVKDNYFYAFEIVAPEENYSSIYRPIFERVIGSFSLLG